MEAVTAAAAKLAVNDDKAIWVRRFRFLTSPNLRVESRDNPYQPWHRYVVMAIDNPWQATYQRCVSLGKKYVEYGTCRYLRT
jgi:hypothetical protein